MRHNWVKRLALVLATSAGLIAIALITVAGPASAHVTVVAPGAPPGGGDQGITFRVPVEKDPDTVGLALALPTTTPIASVVGWIQDAAPGSNVEPDLPAPTLTLSAAAGGTVQPTVVTKTTVVQKASTTTPTILAVVALVLAAAASGFAIVGHAKRKLAA